MMKQVDMFVEAEDRRLFAGIKSLEVLIARLPSTPFLTAADIATALAIKADSVYRWIDAGCFEVLNLGSGPSGTPRYKIERTSFLAFLKSRINAI